MGLPQIFILTLCLRDLTSPNFCLRTCTQRVCSTSREKRTSKHGISMELKLVSIECQKGDAFLAPGKQTDIQSQNCFQQHCQKRLELYLLYISFYEPWLVNTFVFGAQLVNLLCNAVVCICAPRCYTLKVINTRPVSRYNRQIVYLL